MEQVMKRLVKIRQVTNSDHTTLVIFRVHVACNLAGMKFVFDNQGQRVEIPFPNIDAQEGDFVWLTDMEHEQIAKRRFVDKYIDMSTNHNSSRTNTYCLFIKEPKGLINHLLAIE